MEKTLSYSWLPWVIFSEGITLQAIVSIEGFNLKDSTVALVFRKFLVRVRKEEESPPSF